MFHVDPDHLKADDLEKLDPGRTERISRQNISNALEYLRKGDSFGFRGILVSVKSLKCIAGLEDEPQGIEDPKFMAFLSSLVRSLAEAEGLESPE